MCQASSALAADTVATSSATISASFVCMNRFHHFSKLLHSCRLLDTVSQLMLHADALSRCGVLVLLVQH